ncbi:MAG: hypothetical protein II249_03410 [Bacteroidaceae bacterium]|nr:hypothetical protein [Bacteroidaceae bacterium]
MAEYINRETAVDTGYLSDWYISSVGDEPPVWTDAHIDELLNDFIVIPKDTKTADVQPVCHGWWIWDRDYGAYKCSNCGCHSDFEENYCYNCGAKMINDGD